MINPTYVERGGELVFVPPFIAQGVQFFGFLVKADGDALQGICNRYLNEPGQNQNFVPLMNYVLFVFNRVDRMFAKQSPWRERGVHTEQEAAVWMIVWDRKRRTMSWFHPYMIVDNAYAMAMGREVYGFPKNLGWFSIPEVPEPAAAMHVATTVVKEFGAGAPATRQTLITATPSGSTDSTGSTAGQTSDFQSVDELAQYVMQQLRESDHEFTASSEPDILDALRDFRLPMEFVFLKQFRDGSDTTGACYQAIETAPVAMTGVPSGVKLFTDRYEIILGDFQSHPIRADLGLAPGSIPVKLAFWTKFDFEIGPCARISKPKSAAKKKIAILGGGMAAITTAIRLTNDPNWRSRFESITLYQMGWRLGGKGATGRGKHGTIEEHGLHVLLGFYENTFRILDEIYASANRPPESCLSEWEGRFTPHDYIGVNQFHDGMWHPWMFPFPPRDGRPGSGDVDTLRECFQRVLAWCASRGGFWAEESSPDAVVIAPLIRAAELVGDPANDGQVIAFLRDASTQLGKHLDADAGDLPAWRAWLLLLMAATIVQGLLADEIHEHDDLRKLEQLDFSAWLKGHNSRREVWDLQVNPLVRGLYDFAFAYENGDEGKPNFSAAPALRTILRMCLTYKGAVFFKMNAGMGDTIFAPAYEALRNRGVDVKFFHKVTDLELSEDKRQIQRINIEVQATPTDGGYPPLVDMPCCGTAAGNLPCWPNRPRYAYLEQGKELEEQDIDLESFWTPWRGAGTVTLEAGVHFDTVVLGLSIGSLPFVCKELVDASPKWRDMVQHIGTVSTQALQVWPRQTLPALGWSYPSPVLDAWIQPLNTWADMTSLMEYECWHEATRPGSLAYFCGPLKYAAYPPPGDHGFPQRAYEEARRIAERMLHKDIGTLWPALGAGGLPAGDRLHIFHRANVNPSDRYVLSLAGSAKYRLAANASGFDNLVLTGDWIDNGYNAGCVEASVWSGIQAANVILDLPLNDGVKS